jgi:hypothetical protein
VLPEPRLLEYELPAVREMEKYFAAWSTPGRDETVLRDIAGFPPMMSMRSSYQGNSFKICAVNLISQAMIDVILKKNAPCKF